MSTEIQLAEHFEDRSGIELLDDPHALATGMDGGGVPLWVFEFILRGRGDRIEKC